MTLYINIFSKKIVHNLLLGAYLLIFCIGWEFEISALINLELTSSEYIQLVGMMSWLLVYIIPFIYLLVWKTKRWKIPTWHIPATVISGAFATGWLASYGNTFSEDFLFFFMGKITLLKIGWMH